MTATGLCPSLLFQVVCSEARNLRSLASRMRPLISTPPCSIVPETTTTNAVVGHQPGKNEIGKHTLRPYLLCWLTRPIALCLGLTSRRVRSRPSMRLTAISNSAMVRLRLSLWIVSANKLWFVRNAWQQLRSSAGTGKPLPKPCIRRAV